MFFNYLLGFFLFSVSLHYPLVNYVNLDKNATWYLIHVLCNSLVIYLTYDDLQICLLEPEQSFNTQLFESDALGVTVGLHLYHIVIYFKSLTIVDWLHHLISNVLMVFFGIYFVNIPAWNCGSFFMCGLPGGIDYFLLFLTKMKKINRITEKYYNVYLNNWLRSPAILYCASLLHIGYMNNKIDAPFSIIYLSIFSIIFNAIYFAERVTLNYGITSCKIS